MRELRRVSRLFTGACTALASRVVLHSFKETF